MKPIPKKRVWKTPADLKAIRFSRPNCQLQRIGGFLVGDIYLGRLRFQEGPAKRVAIKVFKLPLADKDAAKYARVIVDLQNAGVRLPKMAMVKMQVNGRLQGVQVTQLV